MPNAAAIKQRMREIDMTQAKLAAAIGVATPTMNQKINGTRPFTLDEAEKVAKVLKIEDDKFGLYFFAG